MQTYSSTVDGKTLIRIGGGPTVRSKVQPAPLIDVQVVSNGTVTSSVPTSYVKITSTDMKLGEDHGTTSSITIKTHERKKITSLIDTMTGTVRSSISMTSPIPMTAGGQISPPVRKTSHQLMTSSHPMKTSFPAAKAKSILTTSPSIPMTPDSVTSSSDDTNYPVITPGMKPSKATSILMTSTIPMRAYGNSNVTYNTTLKSSPMKVSSIKTISPDATASLDPTSLSSNISSSLASNTEPSKQQNSEVGLIVTTSDNLQTPERELDKESRSADLVGFQTVVASSVSEVIAKRESHASSLFSADEIAPQFDDVSETSTIELPSLGELENANAAEYHLSTSPSTISSTSFPNPLSTSDSQLGDSSSALPVSVSTRNGSNVGSAVEEVNKASTFSFIGWEVANDVVHAQNRKCHRVLIFKDHELVQLFQASCTTTETGDSKRLCALMIDIAINCAERLKKMKDIRLPNLHAEHMDTLPLTDGRTTKQHLDEISRDLKEQVMINDVAFRFHPSDGAHIGTLVKGKSYESKNCTVGEAGVIVVISRKSKFAAVESFSDHLCRHIMSNRPLCLGRLSDEDIRKMQGTTMFQDLPKDQLLYQNFITDPSIIVAEAARRSSVYIEDFLLFD